MFIHSFNVDVFFGILKAKTALQRVSVLEKLLEVKGVQKGIVLQKDLKKYGPKDGPSL